MPMPRPYADSGSPSSGRRQALSCPASVPDSTYVVVRPARFTKPAAIGSMPGLCLEVDRAGPRGWQRGATSSHVEAHIHPVGGVGGGRPATPCGGRKRGAM
jgi:hypothetical protein